MEDIKLVDVTLHIDETLDHDHLETISDKLREIDGVVAVAKHDEKPHLVIVEYNPEKTNSQAFLKCVKDANYHAELIGL